MKQRKCVYTSMNTMKVDIKFSLWERLKILFGRGITVRVESPLITPGTRNAEVDVEILKKDKYS